MRELPLLLMLLLAGPCIGQAPNELLRRAAIVVSNAQQAITAHITEDPQFTVSHQEPYSANPLPRMLMFADNRLDFDETSAQAARRGMEDMRQAFYQLNHVSKERGIDAVALAGIREMWPLLRDYNCKLTPGVRYYDLAGIAIFCPK